MAVRQVIAEATTAIKRWWCSHEVRLVEEGPWSHDPDVGETRTCTMVCPSCGATIREWTELNFRGQPRR